MKAMIRLIVLLLVGALALSGCSALRSMLVGDSGSTEPSSPEVVAEPSVPRFTFYESWASW
ncbi:MAG: hypothetical protein OXG53_08960 [Chloroflexi bacterium]|nr:hypothetical protein [Chloroflexota bacterium]